MATRRRRLRRIALLAALLLIALGGLAYGLVLWLLPSAIAYAPNAKRATEELVEPPAEALRGLQVARALRVPVGPPAAELSVWILDPRTSAPRATVLVLHGIHDSKRSMLGLGRALAAAGYRAILVDHRGQGSSSGRWLTYGVVEAVDCSQLLDALARQGLLARPLGVVGFSYGGAVGLQLAGRDPRVVAVVSVSAFAALDESLIARYARRFAPGPGHLLTQGQLAGGIARASQLTGVDLRQASAERAVARTRAPVLLVHGDADRNVPVEHARRLHAAAGPQRSRLVILPGKDHLGALADASGQVRRELLAWLERWLVSGR